jgi:hypothetical protein
VRDKDEHYNGEERKWYENNDVQGSLNMWYYVKYEMQLKKMILHKR